MFSLNEALIDNFAEYGINKASNNVKAFRGYKSRKYSQISYRSYEIFLENSKLYLHYIIFEMPQFQERKIPLYFNTS